MYEILNSERSKKTVNIVDDLEKCWKNATTLAVVAVHTEENELLTVFLNDLFDLFG